MARKVNALQLRRNLGELMNEVFYRGERFLIERQGTPVAALVPVEELQQLETREERLMALIEEELRQSPEATAEEIAERVGKLVGKAGEGQVRRVVQEQGRRKRFAVYERVKRRAKEVPEEELDRAIEEAVAAVRRS